MPIMVNEKNIEKLEATVGKINENLSRLLILMEGDGKNNGGFFGMIYDHQNRIRKLEDWQMRMVAIYTVIAFMSGVIMPFIVNYLNKVK